MRVTKAPDERRQEILDCAYQLFSKYGYKKMQMKEISQELGIAHGLVYHYFKSKEALFDAVISRLFEDRMFEYLQISEANLPPEQKLKEIFARFSRRDHGQGLVEAFHDEENQMLRHQMRLKKVQLMTPILSQIIKDGCVSGVFTTEYPEETAHFLLHGELGIKSSYQGPVEELPEILKAFYERMLGVEI